jgi:hypothetical protein
MSLSSRKLFRPKTLVLLIALAGSAGATAWLAAAPPSQTVTAHVVAVAQSETVQSASAANKKEKEVLPSVAVTLTRRGFEPSEVTMAAGRFFLSVENRSGRRGLTLLIDPEHGNRVREFTEPEDELDWTDELHLTPGRYTLAVAGHPEWVCHITVTAQ